MMVVLILLVINIWWKCGFFICVCMWFMVLNSVGVLLCCSLWFLGVGNCMNSVCMDDFSSSYSGMVRRISSLLSLSSRISVLLLVVNNVMLVLVSNRSRFRLDRLMIRVSRLKLSSVSSVILVW